MLNCAALWPAQGALQSVLTGSLSFGVCALITQHILAHTEIFQWSVQCDMFYKLLSDCVHWSIISACFATGFTYCRIMVCELLTLSVNVLSLVGRINMIMIAFHSSFTQTTCRHRCTCFAPVMLT